MIGDLVRYGKKEIGFTGIFILIFAIFFFLGRKMVKFKLVFLILAGLFLGLGLFSLWNLNKKRKILKNMEVIEKKNKIDSYSRLYFILNKVIFNQVIGKIDGEDKLLGMDDLGIFVYIKDKKPDRQGHLPPTKIELDIRELNTVLKTLGYGVLGGGENIILDFTFKLPKSRYVITYEKEKKAFKITTYK